MNRLVNHVFGQMKLIFGRKFSSRFKSVDELDATKRMWIKGFAADGVSPKAAEYAMGQIIASKMEWPPELPEFLTLCEQSQAEGLPSTEDALKQVIHRQGKGRFVEEYKWQHLVVETVNQRIGHYLLKECETSFNRRFKKEYRQVVQLYRLGKLSPIRKALPPPALPAKSNGMKVNPECPIQQRLAALRTAAGSKS